MLKKLSLLLFLVVFLTILILYNKQKNENIRSFDKGVAIWHD